MQVTSSKLSLLPPTGLEGASPVEGMGRDEKFILKDTLNLKSVRYPKIMLDWESEEGSKEGRTL